MRVGVLAAAAFGSAFRIARRNTEFGVRLAWVPRLPLLQPKSCAKPANSRNRHTAGWSAMRVGTPDTLLYGCPDYPGHFRGSRPVALVAAARR